MRGRFIIGLNADYFCPKYSIVQNERMYKIRKAQNGKSSTVYTWQSNFCYASLISLLRLMRVLLYSKGGSFSRASFIQRSIVYIKQGVSVDPADFLLILH